MNPRKQVSQATRPWLFPCLLGAGLVAACAQGRAPAADSSSASNQAPAGAIESASVTSPVTAPPSNSTAAGTTSAGTPATTSTTQAMGDARHATPEGGAISATAIASPVDAGSRHLPPEPPVTTPGMQAGEFALAPGQSKTVAGANFTLERVVNDSRCPSDAQCIWAGEVTIALKIAAPQATQTVELSSSRNNSATVGGVTVEFLSFGPCSGAAAVAAKRASGPECARLRVGEFLVN